MDYQLRFYALEERLQRMAEENPVPHYWGRTFAYFAPVEVDGVCAYQYGNGGEIHPVVGYGHLHIFKHHFPSHQKIYACFDVGILPRLLENPLPPPDTVEVLAAIWATVRKPFYRDGKMRSQRLTVAENYRRAHPVEEP